MPPLRVTVLELAARWGTGAPALTAVDALLEGQPTDLVVVPELALTGYVSPRGDFDAARFAEPIDGPTLKAAAALCRRRACHLVVPVPLREGELVSNAAVVVGAEGEILTIYRKRHPWFPERWATPGTEPHPVFAIGGHSLTIAICYDGHFLADEAADALDRADVLLFPSAWVDDEDSRVPLLRRLAREFDVTIANANWSAGVVRVPGQGGSCIVDPDGRARTGSPRLDAVLREKPGSG